jgi:penicillin-binding protein 2
MVANKRLTLKDHLRETLLFQRRTIVALVFSAALLAVLLARLGYLQIYSHEHYTTLSQNNRVSLQPLAPTRGLIYDRNGVVLAQNLPSFTLELVPEHVADIDETLATLSNLIGISAADVERFRTLLAKQRRFEGVPLRFRLSEEEVARIAVNHHRLPGVEVKAQLTRDYPLGSVGSHVVGYVGRINEFELERLDPSNYSGTRHTGKVGVEKSYEEELHGTVGLQQVETNAQGRILRVLEQEHSLPGKDLYLNIDARLQRIAEEGFGEDNGALVAIEPSTGAVLAMVSMPVYDPNAFVNGIDQASYEQLSRSPDRPLFNRALQGQYPPGSTTKPFLALAALESGVAGPHNELICPGWYTLKNDERRYRDWKKEGHQAVNLDKAIVQSCDVYFYDLAYTLGIDRIHGFLKRFGFGMRTGIDLGGELSGLNPSREWKRRAYQQPWFHGETLITGIGQGFMLATPLQLAAFTATLANSGERMQPRVVHAMQDPIEGELELIEPSPAGEAQVEQEYLDTVITSMRRVVHSLRGTARRISQDLKYDIAGKTGTAQVFGIGQEEEYVAEEIEKRLRDHALFIAFAPVEQPRIAVAVVVENGGSGGAVAAPLARRVLDAYLLE